ncbi:MAG: chemotaxis protein CheW, partial [Polyangiaceae bacterium]|nr:chemotaxis protein CheW [Polyangiaceae bacterium]
FHHRGEVLSAHDVAAFVGVASSEAPSFVLIVEHGQRRIGLLADELLDAVRIDAATHRPVPVAMGERAGCFTAVSQGDVLVLDVGGLFSMKRFFCAF